MRGRSVGSRRPRSSSRVSAHPAPSAASATLGPRSRRFEKSFVKLAPTLTRASSAVIKDVENADSV
jgi:hypothetical protein